MKLKQNILIYYLGGCGIPALAEDSASQGGGRGLNHVYLCKVGWPGHCSLPRPEPLSIYTNGTNSGKVVLFAVEKRSGIDKD